MSGNEIGDIREVIGGLKNAVENLTRQWGIQDREATEGRRVLHEAVNALRLDVSALQRDVSTMKPDVEAGNRARLQASGARNMLKVLWLAVSAIIGALVTL